MSKVTRKNVGPDFMTVSYALDSEVKPGQCVVIGGRYFAVAESSDGEVTVLTRHGGPLDVDVGSDVDLSGPVGNGFPNVDCENAVVICGGTGVGACISVLDYRRRAGLHTWFVAYSRWPHPFQKNVEDAGGISWITRESDRPATPLTPFGVDKFPVGTQVFFAGTKELLESIRSNVEQFGISANNINLNY
jgi:ferredoxin-NADP reductase